MNNNRRKQLKEAIETINAAATALEKIMSDEEEAMEALEENFPDTDRVNDMNDNVETLETAIDNLESVVMDLETIE